MNVKNNNYKRYIFWIWGIFTGGVAFVVLLFILISNGVFGFMPSFDELENPKSNIATEIYSSDQVLLSTFFVENRSLVDYKDISPNLINALIATEDVRFYDHSGIDARGLARVLVRTLLLHEESSGGGSTITQQLAKLLFHGHGARNIWERAFQKLKEWVIAVKLERSYTKEEIIAMYLNRAEFIYGAYGVKSAAKTFFSTSPDSINIEDAAVIIGMLKNPSLYNPRRRPELTQKRRNVVLGQMLKANYITQAEFDSLKQLPLELKFKRADHKEGIAPYFREHLRLILTASKPDKSHYASWQQQKFLEDSAEWVNNPLYGWTNKNLKADGTKYNIYKDGLRIYTTIDSRMQKYAEEAIAEHLSKDLQPKFFEEKRGRPRAPFTNKISPKDYKKILKMSMLNTDRYRSLKNAGASEDSIKKVFNTKFPMTVFSWHGEIDTVMTPMDSIIYYKFFLRSSMVSIDPHNGHVKAYVGGANFKHFMYDMVTVGKRQVGSTIKPFVYTLGMQSGLTPCDMVPNIPQTFYLATGKTWTPRNSGHTREGEMVSLKWGLANSNNNITAWVMKQLKPQPLVDFIHSMGIKSPMDPVPALCLGVPDFSLFELTSAYCNFANKGVHIEPMIVTRIEDRYGNVISEFHPRKKETINEETAYMMINMLEAVVNHGTGIRIRAKYHFTCEMGGKTGTTQNHSDGWFMGVTPNLVTGIWAGGEDRDIHFDNIRLGQGANMALPSFAIYMEKVYADEELGITPEDTFEKPVNFNINMNCSDIQDNNDKEMKQQQPREDTFENEEFF